MLGREERPEMGAMPDFIHTDCTVEAGARQLSRALDGLNLKFKGRRVLSLNFWRTETGLK